LLKGYILALPHPILERKDGGVRRMKPESIPEIRGKAAREFEAKIKEKPSAQKKWILKEATRVYSKVKQE
jgi:hypothetical protein